MKTRLGFVSNSSSSSFLIYGVYLEPEDVKKYFDIKADVDGEDFYEEVEELNDFYEGPNDSFDGYFFGASLADCGDDETMGDFKQKIRDEINLRAKKKIPDSEFKIHEECFYG